MDANDRTRLIKLLGMTGSAHEGEAANAVRLANKLLRDLKLTWAEALGEARTVNGKDRYVEGYNEGAHNGYNNGFRVGSEHGKAEGYRNGERAGYTKGHTEGKAKGYQQAQLEGMKTPRAVQALREAHQEGFTKGLVQGRSETPNAPAASARPGQAHPQGPPQDWVKLCTRILERNSPRTSQWERNFLNDYVARQWNRPSPKQRAIIEGLARKLEMDMTDEPDDGEDEMDMTDAPDDGEDEPPW